MAIDKISGVSFSGIDAFSDVASSSIEKISGIAASSAPDIVQANLVNRYRPANYSGTGNLLDEIGSQDITISGATYNSSTPAHFDFDGVNDYGASSTASWSPTDISMGFWLNQDTVSGIQVPAGFYGGSGTQGFFPYTFSTLNVARLIWTNNSNQATQTNWGTTSGYPTNEWMYFGISRNNSTRRVNMYLGRSTGLTQVVTNLFVSTAGTFSASSIIYGSIDYDFNGSLGELHHYDSELSSTDWTQNFNNTKAYYGL